MALCLGPARADTRSEAAIHIALSKVEALLRDGQIEAARAAFKPVTDPNLWAFLQGRQLAIKGHFALLSGQSAQINRAAEALTLFAGSTPPRDAASAVEAYTRACTLYYMSGKLVEAMDAGLSALELREEIRQSGVESLDIRMLPMAANCLAQAAARSGHSEMSAGALASIYGTTVRFAQQDGAMSDDQIDWFFRNQFILIRYATDLMSISEITQILSKASRHASDHETYFLTEADRTKAAGMGLREFQRFLLQRFGAFLDLSLQEQLRRIDILRSEEKRAAVLLVTLDQAISSGKAQMKDLLALSSDRSLSKPVHRARMRYLIGRRMMLDRDVRGLPEVREALAAMRAAAPGNLDVELADFEFFMLRWILLATELFPGGRLSMDDRNSLAEFLSHQSILSDCNSDIGFSAHREEPIDAYVVRADDAFGRIAVCRSRKLVISIEAHELSENWRTPLKKVDIRSLPLMLELSPSIYESLDKIGLPKTLSWLDRYVAEQLDTPVDNPTDHFMSLSLAHTRRGDILAMQNNYSAAWDAFALGQQFGRLAFPTDILGFPEPLENDRVIFLNNTFRQDRIAHTVARLNVLIRTRDGNHAAEITALQDQLIDDLMANEAPGLQAVSRMSACMRTLAPDRAADMRQRRGDILRTLDLLRGSVEALKTPDAPLPDVAQLRAYFEETRDFGKRFNAFCPQASDRPGVADIAATLRPDEVYLFPFILKQTIAGSVLITAEGHVLWNLQETGLQTRTDIAALNAATQIPAFATEGDLRNLPQPWAEGYDLYRTFLADFAKVIGNRTIIWSPNRELADLIPAMMVTHDPALAFDASEVAFLGLQNPILRVADTPSFVASRQRGTPDSGGVAVFGAPQDDVLVKAGLAPLPGSAAVLASLTPGARAQTTGAAATAPALLAHLTDRRSAALVIATHILAANETGPLGSPGIFTSPDVSGNTLLRRDVIASTLSAQSLILLIGCQSGGSDGGLENVFLSGLPRAFLESGSRSVLVSSNRLLDDVAPRLAQLVVSGLRHGQPAAVALRDALVAFNTAAHLGQDGLSSAFQHPAVWATLVLVGDGITGTIE